MKKHIELPVDGLILRGYLDLPDSPGAHPLLIFFHGFTGDATENRFLFTRLAATLTENGIASLRLSFSGSGESDGDFQNTSVLQQSVEGDAILQYARTLPDIDPERIGLLGMSMGGCAAVLLARKRQAWLKGMILLAPAFRYVEKYRDCYNETDILWHGSLKVGKAFLEDGLRADYKTALKELEIPVHFFHGMEDQSVDPSVSSELAPLARFSHLMMIPGMGHDFNTREGFAVLEQGVIDAARSFLISSP